MSNTTKITDSPKPDDDEKALQHPRPKTAHFEFGNDPLKLMPFLMTRHTFDIGVKDPWGFDIKLVDSYTLSNSWRLNPDKAYQRHFVAVKCVDPDSQAEALGILPGDILVRVNEVDLSKMQSVKKVHDTIHALVLAKVRSWKLGLTARETDNQLDVSFAREMSSFNEVILGHKFLQPIDREKMMQYPQHEDDHDSDDNPTQQLIEPTPIVDDTKQDAMATTPASDMSTGKCDLSTPKSNAIEVDFDASNSTCATTAAQPQGSNRASSKCEADGNAE